MRIRPLAPLLALSLLLSACSVAVRHGDGAAFTTADREAILAIETEIAAAWNRGDLAGHVAPYADSAVFMAPGPVVGRDRIRASLERSFWRDGRPLQQLRFESVQLTPLDRDHALMTGRFVLSGGGQQDRSGWFTLVWTRTAEGWRITHDHSS